MKSPYPYAALICLSISTNLAAQLPDEIGYYNAPYHRYEANVGDRNNATITPASFDQNLVQSEASEQTCVLLASTNSSVEWTLDTPGDGLVIRYSVPENQSGQLEVFLDDNSMGTIDLTSYYSWEDLINNGNPNNVAVTNPLPKMRFDEVRMRLPQVAQPGQRLRLERRSGQVHLDFAELEVVPAAVQAGGGDRVFNGGDLQDFIDDNGGQVIYLPPGVYNVNRELYFSDNGTTLKGAGSWYTQIHFTGQSAQQGGLWANAYDISYYGLYLSTVRNSRSNSYKGINGVYTGGSIIEDVWAEHFETGSWIAQYRNGSIAQADGFTMRYCRMRNNYADGINLCKGTRNSTVEYCSFRSNGDDDMAIWSANNQECRNNTFQYCTSELTWRSAGAAVYGGYNNTFKNLLIIDNQEVGIKVNNKFPGSPFRSTGMHVFENIRIVRCGTFNDLFLDRMGAIQLESSDVAGDRVENVRFSNIEVLDSKNDAVYIHRTKGTGFFNLVFENITIDGTGRSYPLNNQLDRTWTRGHGVYINGEPEGYGTYCNLTIRNLSGLNPQEVPDWAIGTFDWSPASACETRSVQITSPSSGEVLGGCNSTVHFEADATVNGGTVDRVEFYVDDQLVGSDGDAPFTLSWTPDHAGDFMVRAAVVTQVGQSNSAQVPFTVRKVLHATTVSPVLDGEMDGIWENHDAEPLLVQLYSGANIDSDQDLSASFRAMLGVDHLFVLVQVKDESLILDSEPGSWRDDKVEIYVDLGNEKAGEYDENDHRYGFVYSDSELYVGNGNGEGVVFAQSEQSDGYAVEVQIPWSTVGGRPNYGQEMGLEVMVNDDDNGDTRDSKIAWTDATDQAYRNPSLFGTVVVYGVQTAQEQGCAGDSFQLPDGQILDNVTEDFSFYSVIEGQDQCQLVTYTAVAITSIDPTVEVVDNLLTVVHDGGNYQWFNCGMNSIISGEQSQSLEVSRSGSFYVEVEQNGCVATSECVDILISGQLEKTSSNWELVPNGQFGLYRLNSDSFGPADIMVYSMQGALVHQSSGVSAGAVVDFQSVSPGVYWGLIQTASGQYRQQLVVR